ncbi:uncharacterized protein BXZ73DRAFT_101470 [Epithele typhae]|uniref:uncharacterized protein n=1 Tax=Epithele typhae TaxID=378194 RepID=UPI002008C2EE|nr:uncharacterized protein BXZ73DRAFT_101470 [Epithele typhae]KAH9932094.1 hypothetical protein BXZ73DRAFT_101470 [Epithele typhae]
MKLFNALYQKITWFSLLEPALPTLPAFLTGCKDDSPPFSSLYWRLHIAMNRFIDFTILADDVRSPHPLFSAVVTRLDHFVDTGKGEPREFIVAHVALPDGQSTALRHIGILKFERCWWDDVPVQFHRRYDDPMCQTYRHTWYVADDTVCVYEPSWCRWWAGSRTTLLRSSRAPIALPRLLAAACGLRRLHLKCFEDTYAHAWFARALWERLRGPPGADAGTFKSTTEIADVLEGAEAEACGASEARVLEEFEAARAKISQCLSDEGEWVSLEDQEETVDDLVDAVDAAVWEGVGDMDRRPVKRPETSRYLKELVQRFHADNT